MIFITREKNTYKKRDTW